MRAPLGLIFEINYHAKEPHNMRKTKKNILKYIICGMQRDNLDRIPLV